MCALGVPGVVYDERDYAMNKCEICGDIYGTEGITYQNISINIYSVSNFIQ